MTWRWIERKEEQKEKKNKTQQNKVTKKKMREQKAEKYQTLELVDSELYPETEKMCAEYRMRW